MVLKAYEDADCSKGAEEEMCITVIMMNKLVLKNLLSSTTSAPLILYLWESTVLYYFLDNLHRHLFLLRMETP